VALEALACEQISALRHCPKRHRPRQRSRTVRTEVGCRWDNDPNSVLEMLDFWTSVERC